MVIDTAGAILIVALLLLWATGNLGAIVSLPLLVVVIVLVLFLR